MVERKKYCVNGEWKASKTDKWMPVTNSSTGEIMAEVPCCTIDEVEEAIAAAEAAFPEWSKMSISKRTQMMFKWRDVLVAHLDELNENPLRTELLKEPLILDSDMQIHLTDKPGLGIDVDWEQVDKYFCKD